MSVREVMGVGVPLDAPVTKPRRPAWVSSAVNWIFESAAMILMALMAALVFANAISRYAFAKPLPWTEEVVMNLMVWLVAVGIVLAGLRQTLICCDILTSRLNQNTIRVLFVCCSIVGAAAMAYTAWLTWEYLQFFGRDRSPILRIPKGIMIGAVFTALVGLSLTILANLFRKR